MLFMGPNGASSPLPSGCCRISDDIANHGPTENTLGFTSPSSSYVVPCLFAQRTKKNTKPVNQGNAQ